MLMCSKIYEHARQGPRRTNLRRDPQGYGTTADAFRITDTHPEGRGAIACMRMAIDDAGVGYDGIDYVNAMALPRK